MFLFKSVEQAEETEERPEETEIKPEGMHEEGGESVHQDL